MQMSHYYDSLKVSEMGYSRMGPFDLKVVLHQLNRGINHLLHGSQTLFAYTEFNFFRNYLFRYGTVIFHWIWSILDRNWSYLDQNWLYLASFGNIK